MNKDLLIGEVVALRSDHEWFAQRSNPLTCLGVVAAILGDQVKVHWYNGKKNGYDLDGTDLIPVLHPTRETAREAAGGNPNLMVVGRMAVGTTSLWRIELRPRMVMNDDRNPM